MRWPLKKTDWVFCAGFFLLAAVLDNALPGDNELPDFDRDTVLVWTIQNQASVSNFVVRIAEFSPDRLVEWEDERTQGTIFMASREIHGAKGYVSTHLFQSGVDTRGKNATTLWLSRKIYRDLKEKEKARLDLDGIRTSVACRGEDRLIVEVNRVPMAVPVIVTSDDRGSEWWFLDRENNPLMVRHRLRKFDQKLVSITTDRPNTLRWIKGKKLEKIPR